MKTRHLVLGIAISVLASGTSIAQTNSFSNINTNTNTNNNNNQGFASGGSFSFSSGNMRISQNSFNNTFCQFFSFIFGSTQIIQIIQGNSMTQTFGSITDPVTDPCL